MRFAATLRALAEIEPGIALVGVPKRDITPPSGEQIERLLDTASAGKDRFGPLWTVAVYSGCREGELLSLKWRDVDFQAGTLSIRRSLVAVHARVLELAEPKTAQSRRTSTRRQIR
jgi:integrase